ncbi:MAG: UvrD-helicase domain-containing protein [Proteobacteria bacterium]|nr:UvrD-helicase domain-containing protein [Pseudomonadota bacterium]MBS0464463.1 UvrD-helicase domain-containing protein [Pseudomonadota bacterium]
MSDSTAAQPTLRPDWRTLPLGKGGRSLIEASAGTGKTWTIAALYLRLLLAEGVTPRRIVVATFTNAAAAELKQRLRERIEGAHALASLANPAFDEKDGVHAWLQDRWRGDGALRAADATRLALALAELDFAPICTLHSLCLRILGEHPFAAAADFAAPKMIDTQSLLTELGNDLWRVLHVEGLPGELFDEASTAVRELAVFAREILGGKKREKVLAKLLMPGVAIPKPTRMDPAWPKGFARRITKLVDKVVWHKKTVLPRYLLRMVEAAQSNGWRCAPSADKLLDIPEKAQSKTAVTQATPDYDVAVAELGRIAEHVENLRKRSYAAIQTWALGQRERRLQAAGQLGFDDVLTRVRDALQPDADGTRQLADALCHAWPVALIDEFQDTDPTQYAILDAIYSDAADTPRGRLALIGDPKQAIYSFRGGDIGTYERAKQVVPENDRLSLLVNFRSSSAFVRAINTLYAWMGPRLGIADSTTIAYVDAQSARNVSKDSAWSGKALTLYVGSDDDDDFTAMKSCANAIAALLDPASGHLLDGRAVRAEDVAVLVPNNLQVARMVGLLQERGVPCVNRGRASVFAGGTASDLLLVLAAAERCDDARAIRAALGTRLLGWDYQRLRAIDTDSPEWQAQLLRFRHWRAQWRARGVLGLTASVLETIAQEQLATHEGERTLTDLRHLGELLQSKSEQLDGNEELLAWLREQLRSDRGNEDAAQSSALRLESDAICAQVMTLHMSKGLEFGFVFLPLMWKHGAKPGDGSPSLFADELGVRHVVLNEHTKTQVARNEQDERFRVLYVALTRARYACHLWLPPAEDKGTKSVDSRSAPLVAVAAKIRALMKADAGSDIEEVAAWPTNDVRLSAPRPNDESLAARTLPAERKDALPTRHSFSTLVHPPVRGAVDAKGKDDDDTDEPAIVAESTANQTGSRTSHSVLTDLQAVAGPAFGTSLHGILEHRRIGVPLTDQLELVRAQIEEHGARPAKLDKDILTRCVAQRLQAVLDADLDGNGLRLAQLAASQLRNEMDFNFTLDGVSLDALRKACRQAGYPDMIPTGQHVLRGMMTGKIDLVFAHGGRFHVLDWKGSRIGDKTAQCLEDYAPPALEAKMDSKRYRLQALLYTLALERYLRARLGPAYRRDAHLGDCWYLFLRAVGLSLPDGTACGVWRHRFDDGLLDALQSALSATRHAA